MSPSQSPSAAPRFGGAAVPPGTPATFGPISGAMPPLVKERPRRVVSTRRRKRVAVGWPLMTTIDSSSFVGILTFSSRLVPMPALTNTAAPRSRLNSTVFLRRPGRKFLPRTVSVPPTESCLGLMDRMVGGLARFLAAFAVGLAAAEAGTRAIAPRAARGTARRSR